MYQTRTSMSIRAWQWNGDTDWRKAPSWVLNADNTPGHWSPTWLWIDQRHRSPKSGPYSGSSIQAHIAFPGDYLIGEFGHLSVMAKDIFERYFKEIPTVPQDL